MSHHHYEKLPLMTYPDHDGKDDDEPATPVQEKMSSSLILG